MTSSGRSRVKAAAGAAGQRPRSRSSGAAAAATVQPCSASNSHSGMRLQTAHHPVLLILSVVYLLTHTGTLLQQLPLWLDAVAAGQALSHAAHARLALLVHEVVSLGLMSHILRGAIYGIDDVELADRCLLLLGLVAPLFQNLLAANSTTATGSPEGVKAWWGFHAAMMALGPISELQPSHSLIQAIASGTLITLRQCLESCYSRQECKLTALGFGRCLMTHGIVIHVAGAVAWVNIFIAFRKHKHRQQLVQQGAAELSHAGQGETAMAGNGNTARPRQAPSSASGRASHAGSRPKQGAEADSPYATPPSTSAAGSDAAGPSRRPRPLPLEFFGIHIFRAMGLAPFFHGLDDRVTGLADQIEEAVIVRMLCLPVAGYSLAFTAMARVQFLDYNYGCVSYDTLTLWMVAWFMLGRDSVTYDIMSALHAVRQQVAASLSTLSRQKPQTVTELVDSVRQQIAGGDDRAFHGGEADDVQLLQRLGEGSFGQVYKGLWRGTIVAVKSMMLPSSASSRRERMAIMEAAISSALSHPNILQTYTYSLQPMKSTPAAAVSRPSDPAAAPGALEAGAQPSPQAGPSQAASESFGFEVRLLLEYMDLGTLRDALDRHVFFHKGPLQGLDYCAVLDTAADIAKGMLHLHSLNIIHGDLKARNVLLKSSATDPRGFTAKISDFGLSHKMEAEETHLSMLFQGTPTHMAPEVLLHGTQSKAADVYAFGITLWEVFTMGKPFQYVSAPLLAHYVAKQDERPRFPKGTPKGYVRLAQRCWSPDTKSRPTFKEVVAALQELQNQVSRDSVHNSGASEALASVMDDKLCLDPLDFAATYKAAALTSTPSRPIGGSGGSWQGQRGSSELAHGNGHESPRVMDGLITGLVLHDPRAPSTDSNPHPQRPSSSSPSGVQQAGVPSPLGVQQAGVPAVVQSGFDSNVLDMPAGAAQAQRTAVQAQTATEVVDPNVPQQLPAGVQGPPPPSGGASGLATELLSGSAIVMGQRAEDDTWYDWQHKGSAWARE